MKLVSSDDEGNAIFFTNDGSWSDDPAEAIEYTDQEQATLIAEELTRQRKGNWIQPRVRVIGAPKTH